MEHEDVEAQLKEYIKENAYLKQEIRGLKKQLKKAMPQFKIEHNVDIHQILISSFDKDEAQYIPYIIFNLHTKGVEDDWTSFIAQRVYEELSKDVDRDELAL